MSADKASIEIREMEFEDLQKVFRLGEKLFTPDEWPNLYRTWDEYEILERFMNDNEFCLVAEANGRSLAGFAIGTVIDKRRSAWKYGYLIWIGSSPRWRKQQIGSKLLKKMSNLFVKAGVRMMLADTEVTNEKALRFLKKHGFGNEQQHVYLSKNLTGK